MNEYSGQKQKLDENNASPIKVYKNQTSENESPFKSSGKEVLTQSQREDNVSQETKSQFTDLHQESARTNPTMRIEKIEIPVDSFVDASASPEKKASVEQHQETNSEPNSPIECDVPQSTHEKPDQ